MLSLVAHRGWCPELALPGGLLLSWRSFSGRLLIASSHTLLGKFKEEWMMAQNIVFEVFIVHRAGMTLETSICWSQNDSNQG
jgi:hypothetical protein